MFHRLDNRFGHYLLLLTTWAALGLPNLGGPALWDIDEGCNAEAARMMLVSGNYVVPTFNGELRVDKPALLYWLQVGAYRLCGVNEFAARLPSALAALATALLTYELARRQFGPGCGLFAALVLLSSVAFCLCGHFANPDALLLACSVGAFCIFWHGFAGYGRWPFIRIGVALGLGVLAKGPVGFLLPVSVMGLFLLWSGQWRRLLDWGMLLGLGGFLLVVLPWYVWVTADTKLEFLRGFLWKHHVERYLTPLENHQGSFYYYPLVIFFGFMPWAVMMGLGCWAAWPFRRTSSTAAPVPELERDAQRFLWCWVLVYLVFFSIGSTKLPNYVLPVYVPLAVFMGHFFDRWRRGLIPLPTWMMGCGIVYLSLVGVGFGLGVIVGGGRLSIPFVNEPPITGLEWWAPVGLVPFAAAILAGWRLWHRDRNGVAITIAAASILFVGILGAGGCFILENEKSPRPLARAWQREQTDLEVRVACYRYFQPSLVFYSRREVAQLDSPRDVKEFLRGPLEAYLCIPEPVWETELQPRLGNLSARIIARRHDMYSRCDVLLIGNR
jgi:4-amino-4-deoxy-L-arabinose transferase-like glycosyltransferase